MPIDGVLDLHAFRPREHKFKQVTPTTTVVEAELDEVEKLKEAFTGCDGVISALGDVLEQNEWERDSLLMGKNGADGITWVLTRPVRPTRTPFVGAHVHKDERGPINCSIGLVWRSCFHAASTGTFIFTPTLSSWS